MRREKRDQGRQNIDIRSAIARNDGPGERKLDNGRRKIRREAKRG